MVIIAISNQKGGVGKTTIAFNVAHILAKKPRTKVLVIDNDPQGNLTSSMTEKPSELKAKVLDAYENKPLKPQPILKSLDLIGADISLASVAEHQFHEIFSLKESIDSLQGANKPYTYDYVIIDCLPSFGHLHLAALIAADYVLIPIKPAPYALAGLKALFQTIEGV